MKDIGERIKERRIARGLSQNELAIRLGYKSRSSINKIEMGHNAITLSKVERFAEVLGTTVDYLMGWEDLPAPGVTEDVVTFPVIGEVAAGYDSFAAEDWAGDTIDIPRQYLKGRDASEFFTLRVKGDSMYPLYMEGDIVLVLKQSTLDRSGEVGVIEYDGEYATLKKVEYVMGEDWLKLIPVNPQHPPILISGSDVEKCRILGVPRLLLRDVEE